MPETTQTFPTPPSSDAARLLEAAADTERHVASAGWDQPPRMFALVRNATLQAQAPGLSPDLATAAAESFSAVEQEGLPRTTDLESLLGRVAWPQDVDGVALAVERIVVPPEAEQDLPQDPQAATEALAAHPDRKDVRLLAACLRSGETICLLRQRDHDRDDAVAVGHDIAPGLTHALATTFQD